MVATRGGGGDRRLGLHRRTPLKLLSPRRADADIFQELALKHPKQYAALAIMARWMLDTAEQLSKFG